MLIAGAGGFAKETLELLLQQAHATEIYFYDDINNAPAKIHGKYEVLQNESAVRAIFYSNPSFCIGVGGAKAREFFFKKFTNIGGDPVTIISPFAQIGQNNIQIGEGSIIATGTVITVDVSIGKGCLINLNCTIGHDTTIGEFCELSPGVHISGHCSIGNHCEIGSGAVLLPGITLGDNVIVGAGAVVTKNISPNVTIAGVPARPLSETP